MYDVIVIGLGPAGCSAAIYASRAGSQTALVGQKNSALLRAGQIESYYGFAEPIDGPTLFAQGLAQAKAVGAVYCPGEVLDIGYDGAFTVNLSGQMLQGKSLVLAVGAQRAKTPLPGLTEREGRGVSYCAVCDGFFFRGKDVAVLGNGSYALHEAQVLQPLAHSVTICTNGRPFLDQAPSDIQVDESLLRMVEGENEVAGLRRADGSFLPLSGVFVAEGIAGSTDLARKMGAALQGNQIQVNERMETTVPGLYACGDCTPGIAQVAKAVQEGMIAGMQSASFVRQQANP